MDVDFITARRKSNAPANKKKEQGRVTRQDILCAAENVFYEHGAAAATLEMIAARAQVTRGAIYWHFKNKREILEQIIDESAVPLLDALREALHDGDAASLARFRHAIIDIVHTIVRSPSHLRRMAIVFLKCEYTPAFTYMIERHKHYHAESITLLSHYLRRLEKSGVRLGGSAQRVAESLMFYFTGMLIEYLKHPDSIDLERHIGTYADIFFTPFHTDEAA